MAELALICALDHRGAIGKNGKLPWRQEYDMAWFQGVTSGKVVIMGRKTAESIGKKLPGRLNIVVTSGHAPFMGQIPVQSLEEAKKISDDYLGTAGECFVIGGEAMFREAMPLASRMYLTWIDTVVEGADTFFPMEWVGKPWEWTETWSRPWSPAGHGDNQYPYRFMILERPREWKGLRNWIGSWAGEMDDRSGDGNES